MAEPAADPGHEAASPGLLGASAWPVATVLAAVVWVARVALPALFASSPLFGAALPYADVAVPVAVGAVMAWAARREGGFGERRAQAWWLLAAAYFGYGAGEFAFAAFGVGFEHGLPSYVSSFVYSTFYVLFVVAVFRLPAAPLPARDRVKVLLDTGIVILAASLVEWILVLAPLVHRPGTGAFRIAVTIVFQIGDLMVLWALIELLLRRRDPATEPVYTLLALAAVFLIATDVVWGRQILTLDTRYETLLGPGWTASHLLAALAAVRALVPGGRPAAAVEPWTGAAVSRVSLYLAYACGGGAFALVLARHVREVTTVGAMLAGGIVALIALRHVLGLRENTRLNARLRAARDELEARVGERTAELNATNAALQAEVAERTRTQGELERRLRELILLSAVAETAVEARSEDELISRAALAIRGTLVPDGGGVLLLDEAGTALTAAARFQDDGEPRKLRVVPLGEGVAGGVALAGAPRRIADTAAEPAAGADPATRSEICVPLRVGERVMGVVDLCSRRVDAFTEDDERLLATAASQIAAGLVRLRAAANLRLSERNYREVFNATSEAIFVHDATTGAILDVNQTMLDLYGYTRDEALGLGVAELSARQEPLVREEAAARIRRATEEGPQSFEWLARRKDGTEFWVEVTLRSSLIGGEGRVLGVVRDIGERRRAEEAVRRSEERFRSMVQQSYDFVTVLSADGKITYESPSTSRILGYGPGALVGKSGFELVHPDDADLVRSALLRLGREGTSGRPTEFRARRSDGTWIDVEALGQNLLDNPAVRGIVLTSREITERKRAEGEIRRKLKELTVLSTVAQVAGQAEDEERLIARVTEVVRDALFPDDCGVLLVDEEAGVLRYTPSYRQGVVRLNREPIPIPRGITGSVAATGRPRREGNLSRVPDYVQRLPGMRSEVCVPMEVGERVIGVINAESGKPDAFTEHDEGVLGTIAGQLATAIGRLRAGAAHRESEERFRRLADAAFEGIGITDQGRIVDVNARLAEMLGYEREEMLGRDVMTFVAPESALQVAELVRRGADELYEHVAVRKDGSVFAVETQGRQLHPGGNLRVAAVRDITERRRAEQHIQRQLERLAALRAIDAAITGGMDLPDTLDLFLAHLLAQLHVDAADILAFDAAANTLSFAAGKGFRTDAVRESRLSLGECYAGRAALERRTIAVPDLIGKPNGFSRAALLAAEQFTVCFAAPLVAKGRVHGVLEVFGRRPLEPDGEWLDYLETLAGQLAIAIDNRTLFEDLQRSNLELAQAYDTTLEGWSRALELRDRETHGHTARVVDLTVRLASAMSVRPKDLVHVRRGALLHDIGKMAIPDGILLKPGPLTGDEWEVMRQHPKFAFELLSPIGFLQSAIDIPYCHHENWDGSGYPRGLKGPAIPLSARIFAVVDAWDALRYDRPYREAWSVEKVRSYLREQAGKRFDPAVVEVFLAFVD